MHFTLDVSQNGVSGFRCTLIAAGLIVALAGAGGGMIHAQPAASKTLELKRGDHICVIGNTLAERMQHYGWLETLVHHRFPQHKLVFRNLGYSGDELTVRLRSMDFGTPDQWLAGSAPVPQPQKLASTKEVRANRFELTNTKADVIFAFFGYNESFAGEAGLPKFKEDLAKFIEHTCSQKYNGKSAPRLVLFSPLAQEKLPDPNLPDPSENNARLKLYTQAMAEVAQSAKAQAQGVLFVDLYSSSQRQDPTLRPADARTINGVHLNQWGDLLVATVIEHALFGPPLQRERNTADLEPLRAAVNDKNFYWYHRYRTTDGYSSYGDRAFLKFAPNNQSNYEVVQRELEMLDVMTANRDRRIWAVAAGGDAQVVDDNVPPHLAVISNKPGPLPGGKHEFLSGEQQLATLTVHKGMKVNVFATEAQFPELVNPVQMAFDPQGRLWIAAWQTYPHWKPGEPMNDKLLILEDTNGDGQADKCTTFADDLHNPTGFELHQGGVLVAMAPYLMFLKDTDGDDEYDIRERVLGGLDTADTHHTANSFTFDPGGAVYFQEGTFHHTQVETPYGPPVRVANGAVFRYEPRAQKFEVYVSTGFANPHGHVFDRWGQDIVIDGTGAQPYHGALFSGHVNYPQKHPKPPQVYQQRTRPCPALEVLSSKHFPDDMQGNLLVPNVIGFQGILRYKVEAKDSSLAATEMEPIVSSSDPNFRPADVEMGPDGAIYFTDWHNPIIGHMQHNLRDPNRDREHGRVYRVTYEGRPLSTPAKIAGQPVEHLLDLLKDSEDRVRYRARCELGSRETRTVMEALDRWIAGLDKKHADFEHHLLESLWLHQSHNVVNIGLLERVLASPDYRARAAAARVLCHLRDQVSNALDLFRRLAADEHPRVRLEAVRAASFFTEPEAVEVVEVAAERPADIYLDFVRNETMKTLDPILKKALAEGREIAFTTDAGARFLVRNVSTEKLLQMPRSRAVFLEMLYRPGLQDTQRLEAVRGLARIDNKPELRVIIDAIYALDAKPQDADTSVIFDLVRQLTSRPKGELSSARAELQKLALAARQPVFRQIGFVSLINIDGSVDQAWSLATSSTNALRDFVSAMPLIADAGVQATLYPKLTPLLEGLPASLASGSKADGTLGRFVRIELPGRGTLTLAEVEVYSDGRNVARQGRASQKNTAHGGDAKRAIDGKTEGAYASGSQTHSEENAGKPWWEVDLGDELPIDRIVIYNRTDPGMGQRLDQYTLRVLDKSRREVFQRSNLPAPKVKAEFELAGGGPAALVRRAAMTALTYVRGQEQKTFQTLARFVREDVDRLAAIRALQRIPRNAWIKEEAPALVEVVLADIRKTPAAERTSAAALDEMEFADALTSLLPAERARQVRAELNELGVRVIRIGTLFERMSYDKDVIVVKAGKPVEFLFENTDLMPHNLVITQPGSLEEIGLLSEATAQHPDAAKRDFVPQSKQVLLASRLLQPRDWQKLSFNAPAKPGIYPMVCTYPGHWRRMYAAVYVVPDLDAYLENPEAYLAANPVEAKDALLKDRRPRTEWKLEELAGAVEELAGRSYGNGKHLFQVANCVACHKLENVGNPIGPDLAKLEAKYKPLDILKELLDPSAHINEKYQTWLLELDSGKVLTALILEETAQALKVIENPLAKAEPLVLKPSEIVTRQKSPISIMPKGLLDKLTRDEVLDLVAYIAGRGNKNAALFQSGGHAHGHAHPH